jgi:hypothetical protein
VTELAATAIRATELLRSGSLVAWAVAVLAGLSFVAADAKADPPPHKQADQAPSTQSPLPELTIRARREAAERRVQAFVSSSIRRPFDASLARWNAPLCPLTVGLPPEEGEFLRARLSEIAVAAGVGLAPQPCQANFAVIVSAEPGVVLKAWYARDYHIFGDAPGYRIDELLRTPRAVRVWYNTDSKCARESGLPYAAGVRLGVKVPSTVMICNNEASHIVFNAVRGFSSVIVAFDSSRTTDINLNQLADYAAMVGLAEIQLDADVGPAPTILRLFSASDEAKPTGLSTWDTAFLKALYHTGQDYKLQRSAITQSMIHDIAP